MGCAARSRTSPCCGAAAGTSCARSRGRCPRRAGWRRPAAGAQSHEPLAVQHVQDPLALGVAQRPRLGPVAVRGRCGVAVPDWPVTPVVGRLRRAQPLGSGRAPIAGASSVDRVVDHRSALGSVSALSEQRLQERGEFCLDLDHERAVASSCSSRFFSAPQPGDLAQRAGSRRLAATRCRQRGQRAGVAGAAPLDDVAGVQPLAAQQRALLARPVRRRTRPRIASLYLAVNVRRFARSGTSGSGRRLPASFTRPGSSIPVARITMVSLIVISGSSPSPPRGH